LYRIAEASGISPSKLLQTAGPGDIHVVRIGEGRRVASSERLNFAKGNAPGRLFLVITRDHAS